ncbi:MAG: TolC family outer membrane protein [Burkholderiaceae bacterium]
MRRSVLATSLTALFFCAGAHAQSLDLLAAYEAAAKNDPTFAASKSALAAARERSIQGDALSRPTVGLSAGANLNNDASKIEGLPQVSQSYSSINAGVSASMPLWRPGNTAQQDQAKLAEKIAEAQFLVARQDLILRTSQAYFVVLAAQDNLESINAQKKAVTEQLAQAKREFEVGTKTIVDTHEAQARFDLITAQEAVAQGDLIIKRSALAQVIGVTPTALAGLMSKPNLQGPTPAGIDEWISTAEKGNPGVTINEFNAQVAKREIDRNKAATGPTLDLVSTAGVSRASGGISTGDRNLSGRSASIGVEFKMPLYAGGALDSRVREAIASEEKARFDLEAAKRSANQGARQAYLGVTYGLAQVKALEAAEVSANSQLSSTRLGYQVGVRINLEVLNAQQQLANTKKDLAKARYDTLLAGLRLKSAAGQLTEEDLKAVNA